MNLMGRRHVRKFPIVPATVNDGSCIAGGPTLHVGTSDSNLLKNTINIILISVLYLVINLPLANWLITNSPFEIWHIYIYFFFQKVKIPNGTMNFQSAHLMAPSDSVVILILFFFGIPVKETVGNYTKLKEVVQAQLSGLMVIYSGAEWRPLPLPCLMVTFRFINGPDEGTGRERLFPLSS